MNDHTPDQVRALIHRCEGPALDLDVYRASGVFVVRQLFPTATVARWQDAWARFQAGQLAARKVGFNKVAVEEALPPVLDELYNSPEHLIVARQLFGADVGLYNHRFVIKDRFSRDEVFLHQDYCYHLGFADKASFFTPLSNCGAQNGGLEFFLGTHQYGYLGDAGEIDPDQFPVWPSFIPEVEPGDLVVMNSSVWHRSGLHSGGPDRIIADTILQPAHDPSTVKLLCGKRGPVNQLDRSLTNLFKRSRVTRMKELTAELAQLKAGH